MTTKRNRLLLLMFFIGAVLLTASCKKTKYYQLTDQDMLWLVYQNYEIDNFVNATDLRTYLVTLRVKSYKKEGDNYSEFTSAFFEQKNDTSALFEEDTYGQLYISTGEAGFSVTFSWPHFPFQNVRIDNRIPVAETIGGINYNDIIVLDATGFTDIRKYIKIIWYSKSKGVVQTQDASGAYWIRQF